MNSPQEDYPATDHCDSTEESGGNRINGCRIFLLAIKAFLMVFVLQFCLGFLDVSSDMINGNNFAVGRYGTSLYFIAGVRSYYAGQYGSHLLFSTLTLALVWLPGTFSTIQMAQLTKWSEMTVWESTKKALFLVIVTMAWPALNPMM